jgi:hypothetical protein
MRMMNQIRLFILFMFMPLDVKNAGVNKIPQDEILGG